LGRSHDSAGFLTLREEDALAASAFCAAVAKEVDTDGQTFRLVDQLGEGTPDRCDTPLAQLGAPGLEGRARVDSDWTVFYPPSWSGPRPARLDPLAADGMVRAVGPRPA
jgi:hypothetical protein